MKLSLRFILPLVFILSVVTYCLVPLTESLTLKWFKRDLDLRSQLISRSIDSSISKIYNPNVKEIFEDFAQDERVLAIGFCNSHHNLQIKSSRFPSTINCKNIQETDDLHLALTPLEIGGDLGDLVVIHDMSFVKKRSETTRTYIVLFFLALTFIISLITVAIAQLSWRGWMANARSLLKGDGLFSLMSLRPNSELRPFVKDLRLLVRDLERDRKIRDDLQLSWNPQALREILQKELTGDEVLILSNREPYIHTKKNGQIEVQVPASGLVTALEPIMRACSGTWIAHGSGDADREVVDRNDHVAVPPENPSYKIRRVWLTKEEEKGYYYGFSNEGMWPLCHIAHTRPTFRTSDWDYYKSVNEKFAQAVIEEAKTDNPVILIQDYHFALAPKIIREKLPKATIITFWHIPWPNAESFGICPWREEILEGLLGSSIMGFHTRFHCNNFLDATDRFLECRIDRDHAVVSFGKKLTAVKAYPISIEWPGRWMENPQTIYECRNDIRTRNNMGADIRFGIGVDRLDYTKGILERFMAIERLFELYPALIGKFSFVQIAAPTRSAIQQYQHFESDVRELAGKINAKYATDNYRPILLLVEHHGPKDVFTYFRGSALCFVSSLHDGMNLVAKEFISSRDDEEGVLILSQFAGAAKELPEALIVNPYDIDQCAHALANALNMPVLEQKERMRNMRAFVQENNVFRWAGRMLIDAATMRQRKRIERKYQQEVEG
jgi:trehalose-6-phosphate synthase